MKKTKSFAAVILSLLLCFCFTFPAFAETRTTEDYNEAQLAALLTFFRFEITLDDEEETKVPNYEYADLDLDLSKPWEYPGVTWGETAPYSVLNIDFSPYQKLSGKLDITSMNKLQSVDISGTEIDWLVVGKNTELTDINTEESSVLSLDLAECSELKNVNCANSSVQNITLPEHKLQSLHCENNYLTFATLPAMECAKNYTYAPQKKAFFIAQSMLNSLEQNSKAKMESYHADHITWYDKDGKELQNVTALDHQAFEFSGLEIDDQIYAVMTSDAFPELTITTSMITIGQNTSKVWWMFLGAVLVFFVIFFALRFSVAKKSGVELRTDKFTDKVDDFFDTIALKIIKIFHIKSNPNKKD